MLRESRKRLHDLPADQLESVAEELCFGRLQAFPVYECVKIYARVNESGLMTYARHSSDLGTQRVTADQIVSRFKNESIKEVVAEALQLVEKEILPSWPFAPGSSSWVQLEILDRSIRQRGPLNAPTVVFRKAVRLSTSKKGSSITSTPLVERMFRSFPDILPSSIGRYEVVYSPEFRLKNLSGKGIFTESFSTSAECEDPRTIAERISQQLIRENLSVEPFLSPGFFVQVNDQEIQIVSDVYRRREESKGSLKKLPLPIVGVVR